MEDYEMKVRDGVKRTAATLTECANEMDVNQWGYALNVAFNLVTIVIKNSAKDAVNLLALRDKLIESLNASVDEMIALGELKNGSC